ncbi:glycosyltransferase family 9 protein [Halodesulfovibrio spirochaetisodalis]|uniref:glycosyltransferase family 9 protein n=1 Tax=Halodesulfovibrio spirochaetisodalis TaxID=1560234 RepID=UPI0009EEB837|nr:glycosyltransferase family 9 protein [Halodesulfovibrio spirochaetisodalis]
MTDTTITLDPANVKKILVCQLRQIGDVMLSTPVAELLAKKFPDAQIHYFTEKKCVAVLENNPYISKIWALDKKELSNPIKEFAFYRKVARQGFDLMVGLQHLPRIRWISYLTDAPVKLSYHSSWINDIGYTHLTPAKDGYASESKAAILAPLGIEWDCTTPKLFLTDAERDAMSARMQEWGVTDEHKLITVDATHHDLGRKYPAKNYAKVISILAKKHPELRFVLLAGPGEEGIFAEILDDCDTPDAVIVPTPSLQLREVAACQERCVMHFGNCSAPRHMAVAVGTPTFVTLGSSSDAWRFPSDAHTTVNSDIDCRPCNKSTCPVGYTCLTGLDPEYVAGQLLKHLDVVTD